MFVTPFLAAALGASLAYAQEAPSLVAALNSTAELSLLNTLIGTYPDLVATLANATNITIFAPSNAALEPLADDATITALLSDGEFVQSFLQYHVIGQVVPAANVSTTPTFLRTLLTDPALTNVTDGQVVEARLEGESVTLTSGIGYSANVTTADVEISNGIVHIIDNILFPPTRVSITAAAGGLTALLGAVIATNLTEFVDTESDLTIFAPSNAAFEAIGNVLSASSVEDITSILGYHVVNGTVGYSNLLTNTSLDTSTGTSLNITVIDGAVFVNAARVIAADVLVANGVVHVIDAVLNPNATALPDASITTGVPQFESATSASLPFTSTITSTGTQVITTTQNVASGYTPPTSTLSTPTGAAARVTGAIGAAALFGGAALIAQM